MGTITMTFNPGFRIEFCPTIATDSITTFDDRYRLTQYRGNPFRHDGTEYSTSDHDIFRFDHQRLRLQKDSKKNRNIIVKYNIPLLLFKKKKKEIPQKSIVFKLGTGIEEAKNQTAVHYIYPSRRSSRHFRSLEKTKNPGFVKYI